MVVVSPARARATPVAADVHIIDELIEERAPRLVAEPFWPLLKPALYRLLDYAKARRLAEAIRAMRGLEALDYIADLLALKVGVTGLQRVPKQGRLIVIANHPTGIADGIAVWSALRRARPDLAIFANADAFRVCPGFSDVLIPVEWVEAKRTRERTRLTLQLAHAALEAERAILVFPAGRLARRVEGRVTDPPWVSGAVSLARKHGAPVAPLHLAGPHSTLFHFFDRFSRELRDITLFHELLNKRGDRYGVTIGPLIDPARLEGDATAVVQALKTYIERGLARAPEEKFP